MARIWNKHKQTNTPLKRKVFVGMSGGVDSSVAAALLKKEGYRVVGVHLRCWSGSSSSPLGITPSSSLGVSCADQDLEDARRAAEVLDIPFYVFDFEKEYREKVVEYMVDGYRRGITPNPDVECNREIKFGLFLKKALELGADYIATGHYIRIVATPTRGAVGAPTANVGAGHYVKLGLSGERRALRGGKRRNLNAKRYTLYAARDTNKDQSYFLWTLTQEQLRHCLFPIGDYIKPDVRKLAKKFWLLNADKKDSQGICFLGKVTLTDFLKQYIPGRKGAIVTTTGEKVGTHDGTAFYTIGQRHLGIKNWEMGEKIHYVAEKDVKTNTLVIAEGDNNPALCRKEIFLSRVNFINPQHTNILENVGMFGLEVLVRVRYRQPLAEARLVTSNQQSVTRKKRAREQPSVTRYSLLFTRPQKFIAPGQSAVFYTKQGEMLGGGVIV